MKDAEKTGLAEDTNGDEKTAAMSEELQSSLKNLDALLDTAEEDDDDETNPKPDDDTPGEGSDKDADEEKPAASKKDDSTVPQVDDSLLERAVRAGMNLAKARSFSSPKDLELAVSVMEEAKPAETKPAQQASDDGGKTGETKKPGAFDELLEDGFDEKLVSRLNAMHTRLEELSAENKSLKDVVSESQKRASRDGAERAMSDFDARIGNLGGEFEAEFGKGSYGKLEKTSAAYQKRTAVLSEMASMAEGYKSTGRQVPSIEKLFERAVYSVTGKTVSAKPAKDIPAALQKRAEASIGKPGGGNTKPTQKSAVAMESARELSRLL
jgi:hypothetical protein